MGDPQKSKSSSKKSTTTPQKTLSFRNISEAQKKQKDSVLKKIKTWNLSELQIDEYMDSFAMFDKDADGEITPKDLGAVFKALNQTPTDEELVNMVKEADKNKDGTINFEEFVHLMVGYQRNHAADAELRMAFNIFGK